MFDGNVKKDLNAMILNLLHAYDFIEAYVESQESNRDSVGYRSAKDLQMYLFGSIRELKTIEYKSDMYQYVNKFHYDNSYDPKPNEYMIVFANPNAPYTKELSSLMMEIRSASGPIRHENGFKLAKNAMNLINQYRKDVKGK